MTKTLRQQQPLLFSLASKQQYQYSAFQAPPPPIAPLLLCRGRFS